MDLPPGTAVADVGNFDGRYTLTVCALNAKLDELVLVGGGRGAAPAAAEQASVSITLLSHSSHSRLAPPHFCPPATLWN